MGDEPEMQRVYQTLTDTHISLANVILYRCAGGALMLVAVTIGEHDTESSIVGMDMFYFNKRDLVEGTVREGFVGVLPEFQGRGIATNLRRLAKKHFAQNGIAGISTQIRLSKAASLKSAKKVGFRPVEKKKDPFSGEDSNYLICSLN